jgi:Concanavalin A-like lectin/glucanases superfamily/GDSL-like Lipase/Acylhydrolase family
MNLRPVGHLIATVIIATVIIATVIIASVAIPSLAAAPATASAVNPAAADLSPYGKLVVADTPLGYWPLADEPTSTTATDRSGNGRDGTFEGNAAARSGGPFGTTEMVRTFDTCSAVQLAKWSDLFRLEEFSIEAWIRTSSGGVIYRWRGYGVGMSAYAASGVVGVGLSSPSGGSGASGGFVTDGSWHHVVGTRSRTEGIAMYVDGQLVDRQPSPTVPLYLGAEAAIGRDGNACDGVVTRYNGDIAHFAIYDRALSSERVAAHAAVRSNPPSILEAYLEEGGKLNVIARPPTQLPDLVFAIEKGPGFGATFACKNVTRASCSTKDSQQLGQHKIPEPPADNQVITVAAYIDRPPFGALGPDDEPVARLTFKVVRPRLLAFGDSYASGEGANDYLDSKNICHRSRNAYWNRVAIPSRGATAGVRPTVTAYACSGARTYNMLRTITKDLELDAVEQNDVRGDNPGVPVSKDSRGKPILRYPVGPEFPNGPAPQITNEPRQLLAAAASENPSRVDMITIGVGGNDAEWINVLTEACLNKACADFGFGWVPPGAPDKQKVNFEAWIDDRLKTVIERTRLTVRDTRAVFPNATIAFIGYPMLLPSTLNLDRHICTLMAALPIGSTSNSLMRRVQTNFDVQLRQMAAAEGIHFISLLAAYEGHEICGDKSSSGGQAINDLVIPVVRYKNFDIHPVLGKGNETFHPNELGHRINTETINTYFQDWVRSGKPLTARGLPANPNAIVNAQAQAIAVSASEPPEPVLLKTLRLSAGSPCANRSVVLEPTGSLSISASGFAARTPVHITITTSDGARVWDLGSTLADDEGAIALSSLFADHALVAEADVMIVGAIDDAGSVGFDHEPLVFSTGPMPCPQPDTALATGTEPIAIDVLANDSPGLTITDVRYASHGTVGTDGRTVRYVAVAGFAGVDDLQYEACDIDATCVTQAIRVTVNSTDASTVAPGTDDPVLAAFYPEPLDVTLPSVAVQLPVEGSTYAQGAIARPVYRCRDDRAIASCLATTAANGTLDTTSLGQHRFDVAAVDSSGHATTLTVRYTVIGSVAEYVPLDPVRLLDTRPAGNTIDGRFRALGEHPAGSALPLTVAGRYKVPIDAIAVALNLTAIDTRAEGFLTAWPCDEPQPTTSDLNFTAGATTASTTIVKLSRSGTVCVAASAAAHLVTDISGYFPLGSAYIALQPGRLLDTRRPGATVDGRSSGGGTRPADEVTELPVVGRYGVSVEAAAVVVTVTVNDASASGFATVWPCGEAKPVASNLNFDAGGTVANSAIVKVGPNGAICAAVSADAHLLIDLHGYEPTGSRLAPLVPGRLLDTRTVGSTVDGRYARGGTVQAGAVTELLVGGRYSIAADASAVVVNLTVDGSEEAGFVSAWPCGSPQPNASILNFDRGQTIANSALLKVGAGGKICFASSSPTHLIADVSAFIKP